MRSPDILPFEILCSAFAGEHPAGDKPDTSAIDSPYLAIRDARKDASDAERASLMSEDHRWTTPPEWRTVREQGVSFLSRTSKDGNVAAWVTEALVREHGAAGLRDGFRLFGDLIERFWDGMHPQPPEDFDEDDIDDRVATLASVCGTEKDGPLVAAIRRIPLVESSHEQPMGVGTFLQSSGLEAIEGEPERSRRIDAGAIPLADLRTAAGNSGDEFYGCLLGDIEAALEQVARVDQMLNEKCGVANAPSFIKIEGALSEMQRITRDLAGDRAAVRGDREPMEDAGDESGGEAHGAAPRRALSDRIETREDALARLRTVAAFFGRTEPHSILSWQLEECIRWGGMGLRDLRTDPVFQNAWDMMDRQIRGANDGGEQPP